MLEKIEANLPGIPDRKTQSDQSEHKTGRSCLIARSRNFSSSFLLFRKFLWRASKLFSPLSVTRRPSAASSLTVGRRWSAEAIRFLKRVRFSPINSESWLRRGITSFHHESPNVQRTLYALYESRKYASEKIGSARTLRRTVVVPLDLGTLERPTDDRRESSFWLAKIDKSAPIVSQCCSTCKCSVG